LDERAIKTQLREQLPEYMVPSHVVTLAELPKLPNGKLDRNALPEPVSRTKQHQRPEGAREVLLAELWAERYEQTLPVDELREPPQTSPLFVKGAMEEGWLSRPAEGALRLLTDSEIFGWRMPEPRLVARRHRPSPESSYADLTPGDPVVHIDYGIGIFRGLVTYTLGHEEREYLLIEYAQEDKLYVPLYQADRLSRYVGIEGRRPTLNNLGSTTWEQVKKRARRAVENIARELLELYAAREAASGKLRIEMGGSAA